MTIYFNPLCDGKVICFHASFDVAQDTVGFLGYKHTLPERPFCRFFRELLWHYFVSAFTISSHLEEITVITLPLLQSYPTGYENNVWRALQVEFSQIQRAVCFSLP